MKDPFFSHFVIPDSARVVIEAPGRGTFAEHTGTIPAPVPQYPERRVGQRWRYQFLDMVPIEDVLTKRHPDGWFTADSGLILDNAWTGRNCTMTLLADAPEVAPIKCAVASCISRSGHVGGHTVIVIAAPEVAPPAPQPNVAPVAPVCERCNNPGANVVAFDGRDRLWCVPCLSASNKWADAQAQTAASEPLTFDESCLLEDV